ncbi:unnamed protein product [Brachionus calyciflorus]|uniref:TIR domain-containing protein n=1 Tax=Brachionus calyciflorus TaxID=104777 RepID=A0A813RVJ2_9BILA|nr:unnamed protein product [Brachionus calyciflorus]
MKISIFLIINFNLANALVFLNECDSNCVCDSNKENLTILCYIPFNRNFQLPNIFNLTINTTRITVANSFLLNYPQNTCIYSNKLKILDLSHNNISHNLTNTHFDCLINLEYLDLSYNSISIITENSFTNLTNLKELDLSYNLIQQIPTRLFYYRLPNLTFLSLKRNQIKELDVWMLFLKSINQIDLSFNQISKFTNEIEWNINSVASYSVLANMDFIDLRFNNLTSFDDDILRLYSICTSNDFANFLNLFNKLIMDDNYFNCNCLKSYNLLRFFQSYITRYTITGTNYIFFQKCSSPSEFMNKNLFSFIEPFTCENVSLEFSSDNCGITPTTLSNLINIPQNLLDEPDTNLTQINIDYFNDAQIAGYIIGIIGILFMFILLIYCLCPIETLALCFNCIPFFYSVCPCKSGVKREKEFDLFISYNRSNENWVRNQLIPFIRENYLIQNYVLHYGEDNTFEEVFGGYIKDVMNRSSCILFVLSDAFLMKEWNNREFREHLRHLITREKTRFLAVQMHDICDEEVDEYFTEKLQIPRFISLENDEWLFWKKLSYFLYTNKRDSRRVIPSNRIPIRTSSSVRTKIDISSSTSDFDLPKSPSRAPRRLPQLSKRPFLLDEVYTVEKVRDKSPQVKLDSKNNFRIFHETYENEFNKNPNRAKRSSDNKEYVQVFNDQSDLDFRKKNKKRNEQLILEADYSSKLKNDGYFKFRNN